MDSEEEEEIIEENEKDGNENEGENEEYVFEDGSDQETEESVKNYNSITNRSYDEEVSFVLFSLFYCFFF